MSGPTDVGRPDRQFPERQLPQGSPCQPLPLPVGPGRTGGSAGVPPGADRRDARGARGEVPPDTRAPTPGAPRAGTRGPGADRPGTEVPGAASGTAALAAELAERTADLRRVKAEFDNYRKRVRRDQMAVRQIAVVNVLRQLLPVLDAVAQAREQSALTDGFQQVAEVLGDQLGALGLRSFGEVGEPFDPAIHQALAHRPSAALDRPVCAAVLRQGYRVGDHLLRPAEVEVEGPPP